MTTPPTKEPTPVLDFTRIPGVDDALAAQLNASEAAQSAAAAQIDERMGEQRRAFKVSMDRMDAKVRAVARRRRGRKRGGARSAPSPTNAAA